MKFKAKLNNIVRKNYDISSNNQLLDIAFIIKSFSCVVIFMKAFNLILKLQLYLHIDV